MILGTLHDLYNECVPKMCQSFGVILGTWDIHVVIIQSVLLGGQMLDIKHITVKYSTNSMTIKKTCNNHQSTPIAVIPNAPDWYLPFTSIYYT